jgi:hypothetical protein
MSKIQPNPPIPPDAKQITNYINKVDESLFGLELLGVEKGTKVKGQITKDIDNTISAAIQATFDIAEMAKITPAIESKFKRIFKEVISDPYRFYPSTHMLDVFKIPPLLARKVKLKSGIIKEIVAYGKYESLDDKETSGRLKADIEVILKEINAAVDFSSKFIKKVTSNFDNIVKYIDYNNKTICNKSWKKIFNNREIKVLGQDIRIKNIDDSNRNKKIDVNWIGSILIGDLNKKRFNKVSNLDNITIKENEILVFYLMNQDNKPIVYCIAAVDNITKNYIKFNFFVMTPAAIDLQTEGNITIRDNNNKFS